MWGRPNTNRSSCFTTIIDSRWNCSIKEWPNFNTARSYGSNLTVTKELNKVSRKRCSGSVIETYITIFITCYHTYSYIQLFYCCVALHVVRPSLSFHLILNTIIQRLRAQIHFSHTSYCPQISALTENLNGEVSTQNKQHLRTFISNEILDQPNMYLTAC